MDFNNDQNEPQNQQNSNMSYQPKKGTFFKKKIVYGFFIFVILPFISKGSNNTLIINDNNMIDHPKFPITE